VHDDARPLREHRRQERAVEAHGGHQIEVELPLPRLIVERSEATRRRARATEHVDQDVDEVLERLSGDARRSLRRGDIGGDVANPVDVFGRGASGRHDANTSLSQGNDDGRADPPGQ
jgi:hypothetical protein